MSILQQDDNVHCFTASLLALWPACFGGKELYLLVIRYLVTRDISQMLLIYSIETYNNHVCVLADDKLMFIDSSFFLLTHVKLIVNKNSSPKTCRCGWADATHGAMHRGNDEWFGCSGDVAATSTRGDSTKLVNPWIWGEPRHGQPVMWPWEVVEVHKLSKPLAKCIMGPWVLDKSCGEELDFWLMLYALRLDEGTKYEPWMMFKVILYYLVYLEPRTLRF